MMNYHHPYLIVSFSPWPILVSMNLFNLISSMIYYLNMKINYLIFINILILNTCLFQWWRDVVRESTYNGTHTMMMYMNLKYSMILFIISEILFFFSFFWSFFHSCLSPSIEIGNLWPPKGIIMFDPMNMPLYNTMILMISGITITISHMKLILMNSMNNYLMMTIILGFLFSIMQFIEYKNAYFSINDSIYGSIFFLITGFHGFHVIIGTIFLLVSFIRSKSNHFSCYHYFNFEAAAWYWHFVDWIWIMLYLLVYWWMNNN